jgi:hypothetical protein
MRVQFTIDNSLGHELQEKAQDLGFSVSSYVRHLVKKSLNKKTFLEDGLEDLKNGRVEEITFEDFKKQLQDNI